MKRILSLAAAALFAVGLLAAPAAAAPQPATAAAGLCATGLGHRNIWYGWDGTATTFGETGVSVLRVGVESRRWNDCTSGGIRYADAVVCFENLFNGSILRAAKITGIALYRSDGALVASSGTAFAYEDYRDGAGPAKICLDSPDRVATTGPWGMYGTFTGAYTVRTPGTSVDDTITVRSNSYATGGMFNFP